MSLNDDYDQAILTTDNTSEGIRAEEESQEGLEDLVNISAHLRYSACSNNSIFRQPGLDFRFVKLSDNCCAVNFQNLDK